MGPTVGLTFFGRKAGGSIWANGADMNTLFLWRLLQNCPNTGHVYAINAGEDAPPSDMLARCGVEWSPIESVIDHIGVLIECAGQVSAEHVERVHRRGGRAVTYKFGNAYVIDAERMIHGKPSGGIFNGAQFDEVWTTPQHVATCASYWETLYRAPVKVLPHIWEPTFVDQAISEFPEGLTFGYQPGRKSKRVAIFEPNINIVKTCILPMLVCENAYRSRPDLLEAVYATNADGLNQHLTFKSMAMALDIGRSRVVSAEGRYNTPWFMAKHADAVVTHQWENGLNYLYYDALYGGYPLIHNSDMLPSGVGYRYHGFDAHDGGRVLVDALANHDERRDDYERNACAFLETVRATAPANIEAHACAISGLCADRKAA